MNTSSQTAVAEKAIQSERIYWPQVIALLLLDISVIISWIAYHEYQPQVLYVFGFAEYSLPFTVWQGILVVGTPALAGWLADHQLKKYGKRLPIINIGINVVAMIFMAVALTVFFQPQGWIRWFVPVFITGWLISMNIFRSPAISLIERFVPQRLLPAVLALFVLTFDVAYSLEPIIVDILSFLGGPITFAVGGILIYTSGAYLQRSFKKVSDDKLGIGFDNNTNSGSSRFWVVVVVSVVLGIYTTVIFKFLPTIYNNVFQFGEAWLNGKFIGSGIVIASALLSVIIGKYINKKNIVTIAVIGANGCALIFAAIILIQDPIALMVLGSLLVIFFALLSVTALPLALYELSSGQTIFGIGLFYGLSEFADQGYAVLLEIFPQ
ncbi:hypothetical protein V6R21_25845 [Limibacter armeniacum]|uniref:hypothetical protein n=1 Tax=Limibacter armeniacum TaxID=466084 RepID=UPI002FE55C32